MQQDAEQYQTIKEIKSNTEIETITYTAQVKYNQYKNLDKKRPLIFFNLKWS